MRRGTKICFAAVILASCILIISGFRSYDPSQALAASYSIGDFFFQSSTFLNGTQQTNDTLANAEATDDDAETEETTKASDATIIVVTNDAKETSEVVPTDATNDAKETPEDSTTLTSTSDAPPAVVRRSKDTLPPCETFLAYCGYFRFSNRLKEMNRMMKVAMQTHRSLVVEDYYDIKFNEIMDFDKAEELLNARANDSSCWLRMLSLDQYLAEGRSPNVPRIYCARGNCGTSTMFRCQEYWPPVAGLEEREKTVFHNSDILKADNASLIVIDGEAAFHYFQYPIQNFYSPYKQSLYDETRKFMAETMKDRPNAPPDVVANGGRSLGVHMRQGDLAATFVLKNQLDFIEEHVLRWNITRMFIGTDAKKETRAKIQERFPYAQIRADALCEGDVCVVYDQIAMSITDHFIGSTGSTFTDRIMDMRWFDAHNDSRFSYHRFDESTGIKYQEGGWKSSDPEHIRHSGG